MENEKVPPPIVRLRMKFDSNPRLTLEFQAAVSALLRIHDVNDLEDDLLRRLTVAVREELPGEGQELGQRIPRQPPSSGQGTPPQPPSPRGGTPPQPPSRGSTPPQPPSPGGGTPPQPPSPSPGGGKPPKPWPPGSSPK